MKDFRKKLIWLMVFLALVLLTISAVLKQNSSFSFGGFIHFITTASWQWILLAFASMAGFIVFEGLALHILCKAFGYGKKVSRSMVYSSLDIYFSAITPSATGGQPAAGYSMIKDGIPGAVTTIILLVNLTLYTISLIIIGIICLVLRPDILLEFGPLSLIMILAGLLIQCILIVVFVLLVYKEKIVMKIAKTAVNLLGRLHLIRHTQEKLAHLEEVEHQYRECAMAIRDHKKALLAALACNLLQRISQILVTVCVFASKGGELSRILEVFVTQGYVVAGANSVPIPGAVGVADYLFLDGFSRLVEDTVSIELLSRGISFYCCVLICGLVSLAVYLKEGVKGLKRRKNDRIL